jgi:DNA-binding CsgD family transcriptional regulator
LSLPPALAAAIELARHPGQLLAPDEELPERIDRLMPDSLERAIPTSPPCIRSRRLGEKQEAKLIIAAQTRAGGKDGRPPEPLHVPTAEGLITLHGSLPTGPKGRVAVVFQTTPEAQAAPLRPETFGLSAREREVAALVASGLDTAAIAEALFISPWTVQDHCKAIFEKTGTHNRRELRAPSRPSRARARLHNLCRTPSPPRNSRRAPCSPPWIAAGRSGPSGSDLDRAR